MATTKIISSQIKVYDSVSELDKRDFELLQAAQSAINNAYAPYSGFYVGAAVRLSDNTIIKANNQENAAYPSGLCAERVALFYASAQYPQQKINTIAIAAKALHFTVNKPVSPCGACRQVIAEYETKQLLPIRIIMAGITGQIFSCDSISDLLPLLFTANDLKQ